MVAEKDKYAFRESILLRFEGDDTYYRVGDLRGLKVKVSQEVEDLLGLEVEIEDVFKDERLIYTLEGESRKQYKFYNESDGDINQYFKRSLISLINQDYKVFKMVIQKDARGDELRFEYMVRKQDEEGSVENFIVEGEFYRTLAINYNRGFEDIQDMSIAEEVQSYITYVKTEEQLRSIYPDLVENYKKTYGITDGNLDDIGFNIGYTKVGNKTKTRKSIDIRDVDYLIECIREMECRDSSSWQHSLSIYVKGTTNVGKQKINDFIWLYAYGNYNQNYYYKEVKDGVTSLQSSMYNINANPFVMPEDVEKFKEEYRDVHEWYEMRTKKVFNVLGHREPDVLYHYGNENYDGRFYNVMTKMQGLEDIELQEGKVQDVVTQASRYHNAYTNEKADISFIIKTAKYVEGSDDVIDRDTVEIYETTETDVSEWGFSGLLEYMMTGENNEYSRAGLFSEVNEQIDEIMVYTRFKSTQLEEQKNLDYPIVTYTTLMTGKYFIGVLPLPFEEEKKITLMDMVNRQTVGSIGEVNEEEEYIDFPEVPEEETTLSELKTTLHAQDHSNLPEKLKNMVEEDLEETEESYYTFEEVEQLVEDAFRRGYEQGLQEELQEEINVEIADESITHHLESNGS